MKKRAIVLILVGLLCLTSIGYAQVSENYDLSWNVIGGGGGATGSANYAMRSTVGQAAFGYSFSDNYGLGTGYWYGITELKPGPTPVHNLNTGENFSRIQVVIDDSNTSDGHTITVDPGTYNENVVVNKRLTIKSTSGNHADTIVNASDSNDHVFNVTADYVNISGFTVKGATGWLKAGIYPGSNVEHCNISDNNASNNFFGIVLSSSSNNTLTNNTASNNDNGIYLSYSSNNNITNNTASNNSYGISLDGSEFNTITNNNASNNYDGIILGLSISSSHNIIEDNEVSYNSHNGISIIVYGIVESNNNVTNNNVSNNGESGIYLEGEDNTTIAGNTINSNMYGMSLWKQTYPIPINKSIYYFYPFFR